ncbi:MAG: chemotaxis response regulator protein-glutamate methylesterase [Sedimenticola sp.]|nr:chemotaxis response regulator protein-glutamate methylesterase [Sedimenticola sp.]
MGVIKVLVIDDSAVIRQVLSEILNAAPGIEVVGTASDPLIARQKIKRLHPDVLTLDVEMPRMDGITFLKNLMRLHPLPVVMISALTKEGADTTLKALELGAIDYIAKPNQHLGDGLSEYADEIVSKVRTAAVARLRLPRLTGAVPQTVPRKQDADAVLLRRTLSTASTAAPVIIGIGASTGGTEAIKEILCELPPTMPAIVISQHIPEAFSKPFAERLNALSSLTVVEAESGKEILPGHVYIAPGNRHLLVVRHATRYYCELNDGPLVNRHKPSVDVMFRSLAQSAGGRGIGVMLTGMGQDGAESMGEMQAAGAVTLAQDEMSSVVWGMPGAVVKRGFADEVLSLGKMAQRLIKLAGQ